MSSGISPVAKETHQPPILAAGPLSAFAVYASVGVGVLLAIIITVMSARKTVSPSTPATFPKRSKKVRLVLILCVGVSQNIISVGEQKTMFTI